MASEFRDSSASGCGGGWADISVILEWSDPDGRRRHYNCALAKPRTIQWVVDDWERSVGVAVPSGAVAYVSERGAPCAPVPRSRLVRESCEIVFKAAGAAGAELVVVVTDESAGIAASPPDFASITARGVELGGRPWAGSVRELGALLCAFPFEPRDAHTARVYVACDPCSLDRDAVVAAFDAERKIDGVYERVRPTIPVAEAAAFARRMRRTHLVHLELQGGRLAADQDEDCSLRLEVQVRGMPGNLVVQDVISRLDVDNVLRRVTVSEFVAMYVSKNATRVTRLVVAATPLRKSLDRRLIDLVAGTATTAEGIVDTAPAEWDVARDVLCPGRLRLGQRGPRMIRLKVVCEDAAVGDGRFPPLLRGPVGERDGFDNLGGDEPPIVVFVTDEKTGDVLLARSIAGTEACLWFTLHDVWTRLRGELLLDNPYNAGGEISEMIYDNLCDDVVCEIEEARSIRIAVDGGPERQVDYDDHLGALLGPSPPERVAVTVWLDDRRKKVPRTQWTKLQHGCWATMAKERVMRGEFIYKLDCWKRLTVSGTALASVYCLGESAFLEVGVALGLFPWPGSGDVDDEALSKIFDGLTIAANHSAAARSSSWAILYKNHASYPTARHPDMDQPLHSGTLSLLKLVKLPELLAIAATCADAPAARRKLVLGLVGLAARAEPSEPAAFSRGRQPSVVVVLLSVLSAAAAGNKPSCALFGETFDTRPLLDAIGRLPVALLEDVKLDWRAYDPEQRQALERALLELLVLWHLVRPSETYASHVEIAATVEGSDAYRGAVSGAAALQLQLELNKVPRAKEASLRFRRALQRKHAPEAVLAFASANVPAGAARLAGLFAAPLDVRGGGGDGPPPAEHVALVAFAGAANGGAADFLDDFGAPPAKGAGAAAKKKKRSRGGGKKKPPKKAEAREPEPAAPPPPPEPALSPPRRDEAWDDDAPGDTFIDEDGFEVPRESSTSWGMTVTRALMQCGPFIMISPIHVDA